MSTLAIQTPSWAEPLLSPARYKGAHGGRGCVHPDTPIDTPSGQIAIKNFQGGEVWSWDDGEPVKASATAAYPCTIETLYRVDLFDGRSITVTDQHKFLTDQGWLMLDQLGNLPIFSLETPISGAFHPLTSSGPSPCALQQGVRRLMQTLLGYLDDCLLCLRQYDQQLPLAAGNDLAFLPLPSDAQQHSCRALSREDDQAFCGTDSLSLSFRHVSSRVSRLVAAGRCSKSLGIHICARIFELFSVSIRQRGRFPRNITRQLLACGSELLDLCFDICSGPDRNRQLLHSLPVDGAPCSSFNTSRVRKITNVGRHLYYDIHVFATNNYLSNGIVNHNSGKSHFFAELLIESLVLDQNKSAVCLREIQKSLNQSVKRLIESKIQHFQVGQYFEVQESVIKCARGTGRIIFQGMQSHNAETIKSLDGYDIAWFEEAQRAAHRSIRMLRPTLRKDGSELWFSWNRTNRDDPVEELFYGDEPPPNSVCVEVNWQDNPWFPEVLRQEMEYDRRRDPDKYAHVWGGGFEELSHTRVFTNWRVEEFDTPPDAHLRFGADWGFANDPTVLIRCHMVGRTLYVDHEAYQVGCEIVDTPDLFLTVPQSEKWPILADSARPETISHMRKHGFPKMMPAVKGKGSVKEGVEWLKSFDIVVHPRCRHTIDELTAYSYKTDEVGNVLPVLKDEDNHVIDALRYACENARRTQQKLTQPKIKPVPIANRW